MTKTPKNIILMLENSEIPWANYFLTFVFASILRTYLEAFSQPVNDFFRPIDTCFINIIHFSLSYIMLALLLLANFSYCCKEPINHVARVLLPGFILLLVGPCVDLFTTMGRGMPMYYMEPAGNYDLIRVYLSFLSHGYHGATLGIKIEIIIALCLGFIYCRIKNQSIIKSIICIWMCYTILFLMAASPYFVCFILQICHFDFENSSVLMMRYYLLMIPVIAIPMLYSANKETFYVLINDCRFLRILHYALMLVLGSMIALTGNKLSISTQLLQHQDILINIILSIISIFFAIFFSMAISNISDIDSDKILNSARLLSNDNCSPLTSLKHYKLITYLSLCFSLIYAGAVGFYAFFMIVVIIASYYIYSVPPIRFKRVPILSKLVLSLNSIVLMLLGYIIVNGSINHFPNGLFWIFFVGYTMAANFIDIKDAESDKLAGIMTLPTILPERYAKLLIGFSFWGTYISFVYLYQSLAFLLILVVAGGIQFYLINKNVYRESHVLGFCTASVMTLIALLTVPLGS